MSKSRNEKKPPVQQTPVHAVATTNHDIIPGKFNENQWNLMVDQEDCQEFILDLVDTIVDCSIKVIYDKYIESQLRPYAVKAAKGLLLQIIESRFLAHDKGEKVPDNYWCEDEEPVACVTDSWSQGSVPVKHCQSRPLSARSVTKSPLIEEHFQPHPGEADSEELNVSIEVETCNDVLAEDNVSLEPNVSFSTQIIPSPPATPKASVSTSNSRRRTGGQTQEKKRKKQRAKKNEPHTDDEEVAANCPTDNNDRVDSIPFNVTQKVQINGRPPAEPEVTYDEHGNVISMVRLSIEKLPTYRVKTRYNIIDPNTDLLSSSKVGRKMTSKESLLNQLRDYSHGSNSIINIKKRHEKQSSKSSFKSSHSFEITRDESFKNLPPPLADSVNISTGVVIREGHVVRKGPDMFVGRPTPDMSQFHQDILNLQPVGSFANKQSINVSDVVGNTSPVIRQIRLPDPIPPIAATLHRS